MHTYNSDSNRAGVAFGKQFRIDIKSFKNTIPYGTTESACGWKKARAYLGCL